jgi:hypothetical protein
VLLSAGDFLINAGRKLQMRYESDVITPIQRVG